MFLLSTKLIGFQEHLLDNDLLSAKSLTNEPPACSSFSTLDVPGRVFASSDFLEFNKIGVDTNILSMTRYQTWVGQKVTTIIPSALSYFSLKRTLGTTEIEGNAENFKSDQSIQNVSIYIAPESGLNAAYLPNCVLILVAKRSISGLKHKCFNARFKTFDWSIHSGST